METCATLSRAAAGLALILFTLGCNTEKSPAGFRLPDGDPELGKVAFVELRCHECHTVFATPELPDPTIAPPVPMLGGKILPVPGDGMLVTSIINPDHSISRTYNEEVATSAPGVSRMATFNDAMTVQQLVDIVAFLHTKHRLYEKLRDGSAPMTAAASEPASATTRTLTGGPAR